MRRAAPFHIRLADIVIRIEPIFDYVKEYCGGYLIDEAAEITVRIESEDIVYERKCAEREAAHRGETGIDYTDAYLETLAVYRKIAEQLPMYSTILFHGSAVAVDGTGYLFTAKSGTGKSTHTKLWRNYLGKNAVMINDDKPLLKIKEDGVYVCGTPWNGKHRLGSNQSVPLRAICIIARDAENHIRKIQVEEAYPMLLQQTYRPSDMAAMVQTLQLLDRIKMDVRFYKLSCNKEIEAAKIAYEEMKED